MTEFDSVIERWVAEEYRPGVSAGAAARQVCRQLGCNGHAPELKRLLDDMLADFNEQNHEFMRERSVLREVLADIPKN